MDWPGMSEMEMSGSLERPRDTGHTDTATTVTLTPTFIAFIHNLHNHGPWHPWHRVHWGSQPTTRQPRQHKATTGQQPTRHATPQHRFLAIFGFDFKTFSKEG